uniref:GTP-binding protein 6 n=1 Tax=Cacopsylla melanoneura TaxID=428564 RepID=A0A8D8ME82_9HEMI
MFCFLRQACRSVMCQSFVKTPRVQQFTLPMTYPLIPLVTRWISTSKTMSSDNISDDDLEESKEFRDMFEDVNTGFLNTDHQVFVIQPFIKWGKKMKRNTTREFMLAESKALVTSIQGWSVIDSTIISVLSFDKKYVFGKGNLELLKNQVRANPRISAVFVSVDVLKLHQQKALQDIFQVPVFDRYMIVIQIFKAHAFSPEARLQISMAELPYLWTRCRTIEDATNMNITKGFLESKRMVLMEREQKLKKALNKLKSQRELVRNNKQRQEFPVVAVVGYTNCGKTTLIKALTEDAKLVPRNQLFATLDVTTHEGILPNKLKLLYVDTIGFISSIPTTLIEPFKVTLEDALLADIIIHVVDISNPDYLQQKEHVDATLQQLEIDEKVLEHVLVVGNKMDALPAGQRVTEQYDLLISAKKGIGLIELQEKIQDILLEATGRKSVTMRVRNGGVEYQWLMKHTAVSSVREDENSAEHLLLDVVMTEALLNKFKHEFISSTRKRG